MTKNEIIFCDAIASVISLIDESHGVSGFVLNVDDTPWDTLRTGGQFDAWLRDFDTAVELRMKLRKEEEPTPLEKI